MRYDLFVGSTCYVQSVTRANATHIIAALEAQGESVEAYTVAKTLGKQAYRTGDGWKARTVQP